MARIEVWEPGKRLVFVDNRETEAEVTFEPSDGGTRGDARASRSRASRRRRRSSTQSSGGVSCSAGTSSTRRRRNRTITPARRPAWPKRARISPYLYYDDGVAASSSSPTCSGSRSACGTSTRTARCAMARCSSAHRSSCWRPSRTRHRRARWRDGGDLRHRRRRRRPLRTSARRGSGDRGRTGGQALRRAYVRRPRSQWSYLVVRAGDRVDRHAHLTPPARASQKLCLALPEAADQSSGQHAAFVVRGKKFAYYLDDHHGDGRRSVCCRRPPARTRRSSPPTPIATSSRRTSAARLGRVLHRPRW